MNAELLDRIYQIPIILGSLYDLYVPHALIFIGLCLWLLREKKPKRQDEMNFANLYVMQHAAHGKLALI